MGYYARTQPHAGAPFAAMSLYNQVNGGRDIGTRCSELYDALQQKGITEQAVWTHGLNDVTQPAELRARPPTRSPTAPRAAPCSSSGTARASAAQTAIETALAAGHPVAIGMPVYDAFFRSRPGTPS